MTSTITRRDESLPEANAPGLIRDICTVCKDDSLLRIRKHHEREVIAECTWCGAVQRRWSGYRRSAAQSVYLTHNRNLAQPPDLDKALRVWELYAQGLKSAAIAIEVGVPQGRVYKLREIAKRHHGIPTAEQSRKQILQLAHDRLVCYVVLSSIAHWPDPRISHFLGCSHQTLANIKARQGHTETTGRRMSKKARAEKYKQLQKLRSEHPGMQTKQMAEALGITCPVAYEMVRQMKVAEQKQAESLRKLGEWYERNGVTVAA